MKFTERLDTLLESSESQDVKELYGIQIDHLADALEEDARFINVDLQEAAELIRFGYKQNTFILTAYWPAHKLGTGYYVRNESVRLKENENVRSIRIKNIKQLL